VAIKQELSDSDEDMLDMVSATNETHTGNGFGSVSSLVRLRASTTTRGRGAQRASRARQQIQVIAVLSLVNV